MALFSTAKRVRNAPSIRPRRLLTGIMLSFLITIPVFAGENLKADMIIVGPGDPLYTYWGHIGIVIEDLDSGESLFYDFGNFSFYSDHFYRDFALGRMTYLALKTPTDAFVRYSLTEDRDLTEYPLNLGQSELEELNRVLRWWVLPENREYLYDYFQNNCSTVIRDILDNVTDGQLKAATEGRPDITFRHYARTGASSSIAAEFMLHFLLGPSADVPVDDWDMMFLPQRVADESMKLSYVGRDGVRRTLAGEPKSLKKSTRPPVPDSPRTLWPVSAAFGLAFAILWTLTGVPFRRTEGAGRVLSAVARTAIILIVGLPGALSGFIMAFTDHFAGHGNLNLWPAFPTILLGLVPLCMASGRGTADKRRRGEVILSWFWTVNLAGLAAAMILRATGAVVQDCYAFWAFYGPLAFVGSRPGLMLREKMAGFLRNR